MWLLLMIAGVLAAAPDPATLRITSVEATEAHALGFRVFDTWAVVDPSGATLGTRDLALVLGDQPMLSRLDQEVHRARRNGWLLFGAVGVPALAGGSLLLAEAVKRDAETLAVVSALPLSLGMTSLILGPSLPRRKRTAQRYVHRYYDPEEVAVRIGGLEEEPRVEPEAPPPASGASLPADVLARWDLRHLEVKQQIEVERQISTALVGDVLVSTSTPVPHDTWVVIRGPAPLTASALAALTVDTERILEIGRAKRRTVGTAVALGGTAALGAGVMAWGMAQGVPVDRSAYPDEEAFRLAAERADRASVVGLVGMCVAIPSAIFTVSIPIVHARLRKQPRAFWTLDEAVAAATEYNRALTLELGVEAVELEAAGRSVEVDVPATYTGVEP